MLSNELFDKVYTIVKYAMSDLTTINSDGDIVPKWSNLYYGRSIHDLAPTSLPCLYMRQIGAPQVGDDLMRNTQNGVDSTFQVESVSNTSYDEAFSILNDAGDIFIRLGYSLSFGLQEVSTDSESLWRFVARFNRVVGANETIAL